MHVAALQQYVQALAEAVRAAGSKTAADDLQRVATALAPFAGWTIAQWADFLHQAETYQRTGVLPTGRSRSRAAKPLDESKLAAAQQALQQLEEQITQPQFSFAQLDSVLRQLDKQLSRDEALALAQRLQLVGCRTKKAALEKIAEQFRERRLQFQRAALIQTT
jgi:hypothetical protein